MKKVIIILALPLFFFLSFFTVLGSESTSASEDYKSSCSLTSGLKQEYTSNQADVTLIGDINNKLYEKKLTNGVFGILKDEDTKASKDEVINEINRLHEYAQNQKYSFTNETYIQAYHDGYKEDYLDWLAKNKESISTDINRKYEQEKGLEKDNSYYYKKVLSKVIYGCGSSTSIDLENEHYQEKNPYVAEGYRGQCTWFVWGRVREKTGYELPSKMGNANSWYAYAESNQILQVGKEPKENSIIVLGGSSSNSDLGHVAIIESIDNGVVRITEANFDNPCFDNNSTCDMVEYARENYAELFNDSEVSISLLQSGRLNSLNIIGYIYF